MPLKKSLDLKQCIPSLFFEQHYPIKEICNILDIKKTLVYQCLSNFQKFGLVYDPNKTSHRTGRPCILQATDTGFIFNLLQSKNCSYLDEVQECLFQACSIHLSTPALLHAFHCLHFSQKCVSEQAREHNSLECARFQLQLAALFCRNPQLGAHMLMSCDEAVKNNWTSARKYGWSLKGMRCVQCRHFVCGK
ncbi:hypothetical protein ARMGADRAFT_930492 [Armillaria gallica]|uniref:Uncharacterized protein n=1 Tax=Armillaria gallica TaxID=47427 RepID=A0A2H3DMF3_ARMGA|nr:hypothetical protein ARMGADRAFT_930492 [Armillaria gallica]